MADVLTPAAVAFVEDLQRRFGPRRDALLARRAVRRAEVARTGRLDFLAGTAAVRDGSWRVPPAPADLTDRRVEITGPTDRKMAVNALNSGARVWLADLEDANTPHWANVVGGQVNLYDAVRATIGYDAPDGRRYRLGDGPYPTIVMRPRGWHLDERHVTTAGGAACGALVDAGLFLYHNAAELLARGSGPYLYLPKMESHREAELWRDVFAHAERTLGVPEGSVRATALIETIPAAVAMTVPFLRAYTRLLVATCHRRGAYAIGGMAAFVPSRRDPAASSPCPPTT